jgi:hypothetical protein
MMNIEPDSSHRLDVLRDVLGEIETLRLRRQQEVRGYGKDSLCDIVSHNESLPYPK